MRRTRTIKYIHPLRRTIGPKSTRVVKKQTFSTFGKVGMVLETLSEALDVPGAGSFTVNDVVIIRAMGEGSVELTVLLNVNFHKFSPLKSIITSSTRAETDKWFKDWSASADRFLKGLKQT